MKRIKRLLVSFMLISSLSLAAAAPANAAAVGAKCSKVNAKSTAGKTPVVCKKNSAGRLVWTKTPVIAYTLKIVLMEIDETLSSSNSDSVSYCNSGGYRYKDIGSDTNVQVRDGAGVLIGTTRLGSAQVVDSDSGSSGTCVFQAKITLKKTEFYQVTIGKRYDKSFSFSELQGEGWELTLYLGG